jgi:hypothetical protein
MRISSWRIGFCSKNPFTKSCAELEPSGSRFTMSNAKTCDRHSAWSLAGSSSHACRLISSWTLVQRPMNAAGTQRLHVDNLLFRFDNKKSGDHVVDLFDFLFAFATCGKPGSNSLALDRVVTRLGPLVDARSSISQFCDCFGLFALPLAVSSCGSYGLTGSTPRLLYPLFMGSMFESSSEPSLFCDIG